MRGLLGLGGGGVDGSKARFFGVVACMQEGENSALWRSTLWHWGNGELDQLLLLWGEWLSMFYALVGVVICCWGDHRVRELGHLEHHLVMSGECKHGAGEVCAITDLCKGSTVRVFVIDHQITQGGDGGFPVSCGDFLQKVVMINQQWDKCVVFEIKIIGTIHKLCAFEVEEHPMRETQVLFNVDFLGLEMSQLYEFCIVTKSWGVGKYAIIEGEEWIYYMHWSLLRFEIIIQGKRSKTSEMLKKKSRIFFEPICTHYETGDVPFSKLIKMNIKSGVQVVDLKHLYPHLWKKGPFLTLFSKKW